MIDILNQSYEPTMDELSDYVRNPVFDRFCRELENGWGAKPKLSFSKCSWQPGWNIKYSRAGKSLCTIYPRESVFTALVVVGKQEREAVEAILPNCAQRTREIYHSTREGNGQRWLMIDLEDADEVYEDTLKLIEKRKIKNLKKGVDKTRNPCYYI